mgnify:CR=1 FL=1
MRILDSIRSHQDLEKLNPQQRAQLCSELRDFLVESVSQTGGHLASNLGVVELTVALETVFDTSVDRLVFDVGHQSYVHKLLTGRKDAFSSLRQFGGIAGFPKPNESVSDAFVAGHASSSVSIALGMARARTLLKEDKHIIAVMGDGAATGGMAYEGLNDAAVSGEPLIVILNDNEMSIDRNVGGMAQHLSNLRTKRKYLKIKRSYGEILSKFPGGNTVFRITRGIKDSIRRMLIPETMFESMGFDYFGPVDGHDTEKLIYLLRMAKQMQKPVLLHVLTHKGHGYRPAEENPSKFHGIGKFDPATGQTSAAKVKTFSDTFGETMCEIAQNNPKICAITAAMPGGTGLLNFKKQFPERLFDVGIAEEHAVSMAGGLAKQGMTPVVAIYSTFLQRAYDMILQDVSMLGLNVIFAVDRAGLVGEDGETHHGVFDAGFLRHAPGLTVLCPASTLELKDMLTWAAETKCGPVAIRYPRGGDQGYHDSAWNVTAEKVEDTMLTQHRVGEDVTILTYGTLINNVMESAEILQEKGIQSSVLRLCAIAPTPVAQIISNVRTKHLFVVEETSESCGIAQSLALEFEKRDISVKIHNIDLGNGFVTHGAMSALYKNYGLDACGIADKIQEVLKVEN